MNGYRASKELFYAVCGMRAELSRLERMRQAYPRFDGLAMHNTGALLSSSQRALDAADSYRRTETAPALIVLQPLYAEAAKLLEELDRIEGERIAAETRVPQSRADKLIADFNVDLSKTQHACEAMLAVAPYLQGETETPKPLCVPERELVTL